MTVLSPAQPSKRVSAAFRWYASRLLRKNFAGMHIAKGGRDLLDRVHAEPRPVIACMNHPSWWDPIVGFIIAARCFAGRPFLAPMEMAQWHKFGFMRRLGLFGLDHQQPGAMEAMVGYVAERFEAEPRTVLGITPQGMFTDARTPVRIRPGVSALASRAPEANIVSITVEYAFWNEQRPEIFVRAQACDEPVSASTTDRHRAITGAMQANARELAALVIARDPDAFEPLLAHGGSSVNPIYDLWLRLHGQEPGIALRRNTP